MENNKINIWIIILFAIIFRIICFVGIVGGDPYGYADMAWKIMEGKFDITNPESPFAFRYTILYPVAFCFRLFGVNKISGVIFPFLLSIAEIFTIFLLGKKLFNKEIGIIGAALLSFFPMHVFFSTQLYVDIQISLFINLALILVLYKANPVYYFLSGVFIYFAYVCRSTSIIGGTVPIFYLIKEKKYKNISFIFIGFLVSLIIASIWYLIKTGDFLFDHRYLGQVYYYQFQNQYLFNFLKLMFAPPFSSTGRISTGTYYLGFIYYFVFIYIIYYFIRLRYKKFIIKEIPFCIIWLICFYFWCEYIFPHIIYIRLPEIHLTNPRYISLLQTPTILILANFIYEWQRDNFLIDKIATWVYKKLKILSILTIIIWGCLSIFLIFGRTLILSISMNFYNRGERILTFFENYPFFISIYYTFLFISIVITSLAVIILAKLKISLIEVKTGLMYSFLIFFIVIWALLSYKLSSFWTEAAPLSKQLPIYKIIK